MLFHGFLIFRFRKRFMFLGIQLLLFLLLYEFCFFLDYFLFVFDIHVFLYLSFFFLVDFMGQLSYFSFNPIKILFPLFHFILVFIFLIKIFNGFFLNTAFSFQSLSLSFKLFDPNMHTFEFIFIVFNVFALNKDMKFLHQVFNPRLHFNYFRLLRMQISLYFVNTGTCLEPRFITKLFGRSRLLDLFNNLVHFIDLCS